MVVNSFSVNTDLFDDESKESLNDNDHITVTASTTCVERDPFTFHCSVSNLYCADLPLCQS